jgi:hypothetical protein
MQSFIASGANSIGRCDSLWTNRPFEIWRNQLLNALVTPTLEAVIALGNAAQHAVDAWPGSAALKSQGRVFSLKHPTAQPDSSVINGWNGQLAAIAAKVTPDATGTVDTTPYAGPTFQPSDLERIPLRDFCFGAPAWMGKGDGAARLNTNQPLPQQAQTRPTILWWAIEDEG